MSGEREAVFEQQRGEVLGEAQHGPGFGLEGEAIGPAAAPLIFEGGLPGSRNLFQQHAERVALMAKRDKRNLARREQRSTFAVRRATGTAAVPGAARDGPKRRGAAGWQRNERAIA